MDATEVAFRNQRPLFPSRMAALGRFRLIAYVAAEPSWRFRSSGGRRWVHLAVVLCLLEKYYVVTRWLGPDSRRSEHHEPGMGLDAGVSLARFSLRLAECNLGLVVITTWEHLAIDGNRLFCERTCPFASGSATSVVHL